VVHIVTIVHMTTDTSGGTYSYHCPCDYRHSLQVRYSEVTSPIDVKVPERDLIAVRSCS
jgi:hypothetical protein